MPIPLLDHHHHLVHENASKNSLVKFNHLLSYSLWAFLLSVLIYLSVFYIFSFSPSSLLCTTKFWFVISNTLILIIAADFRHAFSSPSSSSSSSYKNNRHHFYQQPYFTDHGHDSTHYTNFKINTTAIPFYHFHDLPNKMNDNKYNANANHKEEFIQEKTIHVVLNQDQTDHGSHNASNSHDDDGNLNCGSFGKMNRQEGEVDPPPKVAKCVRTYSDRVVLTAEGNEDKPVLQRTVSEGFEVKEELRTEGDDEFSKMSVEELNRRVEEFITRFNMQMRLQGARTRQKLKPRQTQTG